MSHLEARLEKDLSRIREQIAQQATEVEEAVRNAIHALQTGDRALAYGTILGDHQINRRMRSIDRLCHGFFAIHLPSAGHLRLLSSAIRVNIELERIGDYAVTICREAVQFSATPGGAMARELERTAGEALLMLRQSIKAFNGLNDEMARSTMVLAEQMETNLDVIYDELLANTDHQSIKDLLAMFVVFTQVKRVADQAKNLCEETVFAVTGNQKAPKTYHILFLDEDNSSLSQMAEAIARNSFPDSGRYRSAGRNPAPDLSPSFVGFCEKRGLDIRGAKPSPLAMPYHELAEQHVIVSLQGEARSYLEAVPFHTSALDWDLGEAPEGDDEQRFEEIYRELAVRIKDLMELLRGEGAS